MFNTFFQTGGFNMENMGRGRSTTYQFTNGNASYQVYSSFPGGGSMSYTFVDGDEEDSRGGNGEDDQDLFSQFFKEMEGRAQPTNDRDNSHRNNKKNDRKARRAHTINSQRISYSQKLAGLCMHIMPLLCLVFFVFIPYLNSR